MPYFFCRGWSDLDKISETGAEWHVDCGDVVEIETRCRIATRPADVWTNGMSSQSHVSHCRVLPLGEFIVMIQEPYATLQGAVTWRNQCHDRATLQGVRIPSAILKKNRFSSYFIFLFLMQFRLWRAAAFVSSPTHLFYETYQFTCAVCFRLWSWVVMWIPGTLATDQWMMEVG